MLKICCAFFVGHLEAKEVNTENYTVCETNGCQKAAKQLSKFLNTKFDPCNDFYKFVCGQYVKTTKIPDDKSAISTNEELSDIVTGQLEDLLDQEIQESEPRPFKLVKKIFNLCLDTEAIEQKGVDFLKDYVTFFGGWPVIEGPSWNQTAFNWVHATQKMFDHGFSINAVINVYITINATNTNQRIIEINQAALSVDREHFMRGLRSHIVKAYFSYMVDTALMFGAENATLVRKELLRTLRFEMALANISVRVEDLRNHTLMNNPMPLHHLQTIHHYFQWREYIRYLMPEHMKLKIGWEEIINLNVPSYFVKLERLLKRTKKRVIGNYLMWRAVAEKVPFLPEEFRKRRLRYLEEVTGKKKYAPRKEICADTASSMLSLAVSAMYVRKHFKDEVKEKVGMIVESLLQEVIMLLKNIDWMDEQTRKLALEKAKAIYKHIAYPAELKDNSKLEKFYEKLNVSEDDLFLCANNVSKFENDLIISLLRKRVNKTDWTDHGDAAVVNAYFDPTENSIEIPAGILQGLYFDSDRPMYMNYGGIGSIIAHEMTHAFDDEGSQFDKDGNLAEWWDENTKLLYLEKANQTVEHYSNYSIRRIKLNGINCQGEAIADHGGIKLAYNAYETWVTQHGEEPRLPTLEKYTPKQLFWITHASTYCTAYRPQLLKLLMISDCHPPSDFRVNIPLRNHKTFAKDFNCPINSYMNPPVKYNV